MHKNPVAIVLTVFAVVIVAVFLYAVYKVYQHNYAVPASEVSGDYVTTEGEEVTGDAEDVATEDVLPLSASTGGAVAAEGDDTLPAVDDTITSPAPSDDVAGTHSPATGPGAMAALLALAGASATALFGYNVLRGRGA